MSESSGPLLSGDDDVFFNKWHVKDLTRKMTKGEKKSMNNAVEKLPDDRLVKDFGEKLIIYKYGYESEKKKNRIAIIAAVLLAIIVVILLIVVFVVGLGGSSDGVEKFTHSEL
jgi:hypothetical protein